jgi:integral membrane protein
MALVAGVMSLLLWFVDLPVAYLFNNEDWKAAVAWIPFVHGWVYAVYVLVWSIHSSVKSPLVDEKDDLVDLGRHLPVASIAAERRVVRQYS